MLPDWKPSFSILVYVLTGLSLLSMVKLGSAASCTTTAVGSNATSGCTRVEGTLPNTMVMLGDGTPNMTLGCCGVVTQATVDTSSRVAALGKVYIQAWRLVSALGNQWVMVGEMTPRQINLGAGGVITITGRMSVEEGDRLVLVSESLEEIFSHFSTCAFGSYDVFLDNFNHLWSVGDQHQWPTVPVARQAYRFTYNTTASTAPTLTSPVLIRVDNLQPVGTILDWVNATDLDPDDTVFTFASTGTASPYFAVNTTSGAIYVNDSLNGLVSQLSMQVTAYDHCLTASTSNTITIAVSQGNRVPAFLSFSSPGNISVLQFSAKRISSFSAWDPDNDPFVCAVASTTPSGPEFFITNPSSQSFELWSGNNTGFSSSSYSLLIECSDNGLSASNVTRNFVVNVLANVPPIATNLPATHTLNASTYVANTNFYPITTFDKEGYTVNCTMTSETPNTGLFYLGGTTGCDVYATRHLKLENYTTYTVNVIFSDGLINSNSYSLTVNLVDVNQVPIFSNLPGTATVAETVTTTTALYTLTATDANARDTIRYRLDSVLPSVSGLFSVAAASGVVSIVNPSLDYEAGPTQYALSITVYDQWQDGLSSILTVSVTDVNEAPVFNASIYRLDAPEGNTGDTLPMVGWSVTDVDLNDNLTFTMGAGTYASSFTVNSATGQLTYAQSFDFEAGNIPAVMPVNLIATDLQGLSAQVQVDVYVTDANDNSPIFQQSSYSGVISPYVSVGDVLLQVLATDADAGAFGKITYGVFGNGYGILLFNVTQDGNLTVTAAAQLPGGTTFTFTITATDAGGLQTTAIIYLSTTATTLNLYNTTAAPQWSIFSTPDGIGLFVASLLIGLGLLGLIACLVIRYLMINGYFRKLFKKKKKEEEEEQLNNHSQSRHKGPEDTYNFKYGDEAEAGGLSSPSQVGLSSTGSAVGVATGVAAGAHASNRPRNLRGDEMRDSASKSNLREQEDIFRVSHSVNYHPSGEPSSTDRTPANFTQNRVITPPIRSVERYARNLDGNPRGESSKPLPTQTRKTSPPYGNRDHNSQARQESAPSVKSSSVYMQYQRKPEAQPGDLRNPNGPNTDPDSWLTTYM